MLRLCLALLIIAVLTASARAQPPANVPAEVMVPTALIEQIYTYLKDRPFADVAPLIDGMRQAVAKAGAKPPHADQAPAAPLAPHSP
jgi:hypothetical protein